MQTSSGPHKHLLEFVTDKKVTLDAILRQIPYTARCTHCSQQNMCNGYHDTLPPSINIAPNMVVVYPKPTPDVVQISICYYGTGGGPKEDYICSLNLPSVCAG